MGRLRVFAVLCVTLVGCLSLSDLSGGDSVRHDAPVDVDGGAGGSSEAAANGSQPEDAGSDAPACDADLTLDPTNCGLCGHGCLGGECIASACAPVGIVTPVSEQGSNEDLEIMAGRVYWSNFGNGTIYSVPIEGGQPVLFASGIDQPVGLFARGGQMLVTSFQDGLLGIAPAPGIDGGLRVLASGLGKASCLAMDLAGNAYIPDFDGRVLRVGPGGAVTEITSGQNLPWGVSVDDTYVYWSNLGTNTILRSKLDGSEQTVLASGEDSPGCLAMDAKYLYWPANDHGLRRMPKGGGTPVTIGVGKAYLGVALDGVSVYYTDNGRIVRLALPSP